MIMSDFSALKPPLAVHFVWRTNSGNKIFDLIQKFRKYLTRDIDRPFSRELNIPTFLYSSRNPKEVPKNIPQKCADIDLVFFFSSVQTINDKWKDYITSLPKGMKIIPVAVDEAGVGFNTYEGPLRGRQFIRSYDWPSATWKRSGILELIHEIYRYGILDVKYNSNEGRTRALKLFLSHAKKDSIGVDYAKSIEGFIKRSNMESFFDKGIRPGSSFIDTIEEEIDSSTLLAITTDHYSSRYWCQREILAAKSFNRPILTVNCLEKYEDRIFPAAANVPCVHVRSEKPLKEKDIINILTAAVVETIRFEHAKKLLEKYKELGWIVGDPEVFARPPEVQQIVSLSNNRNMKEDPLRVCYPEPPLYEEEYMWMDKLNVKVSTPLWSDEHDKDNPLKLKITLSVSGYTPDGYEDDNIHPDELIRFSQTLARHLLARECTLAYGGDLREDGFTQFILDETAVLRDRLQEDTNLHIENYLSWPVYVKTSSIDWHARYPDIVEKNEVKIPVDISNDVDKTEYLEPDCVENRYIWSRCLSTMREQIIPSSVATIFAGGKIDGFVGKMPGVLEEFMIAQREGKPIYMVGGLGGATKILCDFIKNPGSIPQQFTEEWQCNHTAGYADLQEYASRKGYSAKYKDLQDTIVNMNINILAKRAGLDIKQYIHLMETPFVDEAVRLILKGLREISKQNNNDSLGDNSGSSPASAAKTSNT